MIDKLKKYKPDPAAFLAHKTNVGFPDWEFEEVCKYMGYEWANNMATQHYRVGSKAYVNSTLLRTWAELHATHYIIDIFVDNNEYWSTVKVDRSGNMFPDYKENFREFETIEKAKYGDWKIKARAVVAL